MCIRDSHYTREVVKKGDIKLAYIPTSENPADIMTKPLTPQKHLPHFLRLMTFLSPSGDLENWQSSTIQYHLSKAQQADRRTLYLLTLHLGYYQFVKYEIQLCGAFPSAFSLEEVFREWTPVFLVLPYFMCTALVDPYSQRSSPRKLRRSVRVKYLLVSVPFSRPLFIQYFTFLCPFKIFYVESHLLFVF